MTEPLPRTRRELTYRRNIRPRLEAVAPYPQGVDYRWKVTKGDVSRCPVPAGS